MSTLLIQFHMIIDFYLTAKAKSKQITDLIQQNGTLVVLIIHFPSAIIILLLRAIRTFSARYLYSTPYYY